MTMPFLTQCVCVCRPKDAEGIAFDDASYTCVKLNNDLYISMKQVNKFLAFVCVIRDEIFSENRGIFLASYSTPFVLLFICKPLDLNRVCVCVCLLRIGIMDYNLTLYKDSVREIFQPAGQHGNAGAGNNQSTLTTATNTTTMSQDAANLVANMSLNDGNAIGGYSADY